MFGQKRNAEASRESDAPRYSDPQRAQPNAEEIRVFQIGYGAISKIALRIMPDRVLRTLFLYEPRSGDESRFVRIRLPDGALPDGGLLPEHRDGIVSQWAKEDVDAYLDLSPMTHALDPSDRGEGMSMGRVVDQPAPRFQRTATSVAAAQEPVRQRPQPQSQPEKRQRRPSSGPSTGNRAGPKAMERWRGVILFCGIDSFKDRAGHGYDSYAVTIEDDQGVKDTIIGCDLERKLSDAGAARGDYVTIKLIGRKGRRKIFEVFVE